MNTRKWFQVLVVGGGALACGVPLSTKTDDVKTSAPVVEAADAAELADAGPVEPDAGRGCVVGEFSRFVDEETPGACCIWGVDHPCCP